MRVPYPKTCILITTAQAAIPTGFFFLIRFGLSSQSLTFYARKTTESAVRFLEWVTYLGSKVRGAECKSPLVYKSDLKSEVAPNPPKDRFSNEGKLQLFFGRIMHRRKNLELHLSLLEKQTLQPSTPRRDFAFVSRSVWLISTAYQSKTIMNAIKVKIQPDEIWSA